MQVIHCTQDIHCIAHFLYCRQLPAVTKVLFVFKCTALNVVASGFLMASIQQWASPSRAIETRAKPTRHTTRREGSAVFWASGIASVRDNH